MNIIEHFAFLEARKRLKEAFDGFESGHMIFIIGPSGAGKTTLRHAVMREVFGKPLEWGTGRIPIIETFAKLPHNAYFSSRELAKAFIYELQSPNLRWLLKDSDLSRQTVEVIQRDLSDSANVSDLLPLRQMTEGEHWRTLSRTLKMRSCKFLSIDQVTALLKNRRDTSPSDHTEHLMFFAEESEIMFVMTGVHQAALLWDIHSELRRRVTTVWLPPYSPRRKRDQEYFLRLLKNICTSHSFSPRDLPYRMAHDILAATGGVIGEITKLFERARLSARINGQPSIHRKDVESSYYNQRDIDTLWRDVQAFEETMAAGNVAMRASQVASQWSH
jgi:DNA polymerase III delta prime subunit